MLLNIILVFFPLSCTPAHYNTKFVIPEIWKTVRLETLNYYLCNLFEYTNVSHYAFCFHFLHFSCNPYLFCISLKEGVKERRQF